MRHRNFVLRLIALAIGAMPWQGVLPNPTGPTPVRGVAAISGLGTSSLTVNTNNAKAIIHWQGFSIGGDEITRFTQPSTASAVLNRVTSTQASSILGSLQSNGRVFLINPNGIVFGPSATVDVAGLVASSLDLANDDFLSGRLRFAETPGAKHVVTTSLTRGAGPPGTSGPGTAIRAAPGGFVYLVAPVIENGGDIGRTAGASQVILAAAKSVEIVNPGTPDVTVNVVARPDNRLLHSGIILVDSGSVNMFAGVIDIDFGGSIGAGRAVAGTNGTVTLKSTGDINIGSFPAFQSATTPNIAATGDVLLDAGGTITMSEGFPPFIATIRAAKVSLNAGGEITQIPDPFPGGPSIAASNLAITANGNASLGAENQVAGFGGSVAGDVRFVNTSPTLTVPGLTVGPSHSLSLTQHGNLAIKGNVTSGAQTISATGNVLVKPGSAGGLMVHAEGPQSIRSGGDMIIQGGATRHAFALVSSSDDIDLTVGGTLRLNSGRVPQARARVQTEDRRSTITLHFPNLSSGGWFVNDREGAIRRRQSGFLSGNGAAVRGKTLVVDHGP